MPGDSASAVSDTKKTLVFYSRGMRGNCSAQSLAALMSALKAGGRDIRLITEEIPQGDDFVFDAEIPRCVTAYLELEGYTPGGAFYKLLGEIDANTVVFFPPHSEKTLQYFAAAEKLGRCIVLALDRSPLSGLSAGSARMCAELAYMLRKADLVISPSAADCRMADSLGVARCVRIPYFFPYSDSEISPAPLEGRHIAYFVASAAANLERPVAAFMKVRQKYPDATLYVAAGLEMKAGKRLTDFFAALNALPESEGIRAEMKLLKPLRALRGASVAMTYAPPVHMPKSVMEGIAAGISSLLLRDFLNDADTNPAVTVNAADTDAIEAALEQFMQAEERAAFSDAARSLLEDGCREGIVKQWEDALAQAGTEHLAKLEESYALFKRVWDELKGVSAADMQRFDTVFGAMADRKIPAGTIAAAALCRGIPTADVLASFDRLSFKAFDAAYALRTGLETVAALERFAAKHKGEPEKLYFAKNLALPDMATYLAVCGLQPEDAVMALPGIRMDARQAAYVLQGCIGTDKYISAEKTAAPALFDNEFPPGGEPAAVNAALAVKGFMRNRLNVLNYAGFGILRLASRLQDRYVLPMSELPLPYKILFAPFKLRASLRENIHLSGKRRLAARVTREVDPGDIRKIQLLVFKIYLEFERICQKHHLRYYIAGGSILGAVRHKGFIPWDDDMDITMPRADYEKLLKIAPKELDPEFILEKDCVPFCHNRIEIRGTKFETGLRNGRIFLDILALEPSPDDEKKRLEHEAKCRFWRTCMLEKARDLPAMSFTKTARRVYFRRLLFRMIPRRFLKWRWHRWATRYLGEKTATWVCLPASIYTYDQERFPVEYWGEPVMLEFEGRQVPTMSHWEDYLVCHFGDYMKMPPVTTRKSHHYVYEYSLGKYADIPVEELEQMVLGKPKNTGEDSK